MTLKTRIYTHYPRVSLARFTFCWWRHNRLAMTSQWPDNCDANTWQVISNSLDIDFIHGDIHGRSCKKMLIGDLYLSVSSQYVVQTHVHSCHLMKVDVMIFQNLVRPEYPFQQDILPRARLHDPMFGEKFQHYSFTEKEDICGCDFMAFRVNRYGGGGGGIYMCYTGNVIRNFL